MFLKLRQGCWFEIDAHSMNTLKDNVVDYVYSTLRSRKIVFQTYFSFYSMVEIPLKNQDYEDELVQLCLIFNG